MPKEPSSRTIGKTLRDAARATTQALRQNGYEIRYPPDWQTHPHFHAKTPDGMWLHVHIRKETDDRFLRHLRTTERRARNLRPQEAP